MKFKKRERVGGSGEPSEPPLDLPLYDISRLGADNKS